MLLLHLVLAPAYTQELDKTLKQEMITYLKKPKKELEKDKKVTFHNSLRHFIFSAKLSDGKKYVFKRKLPKRDKGIRYRHNMVGDELVRSYENYQKFLQFKQERSNSKKPLQYFDAPEMYKIHYGKIRQKSLMIPLDSCKAIFPFPTS